ncbi:MAG: hypothetical protein KBT20_10135 [Bacteroidales bacterium]|nr:hypothetical protein [Candidatus Liminaster caballi]
MKKIIRKIYVKWLCLIGKAIDISSTSKYPSGYLSNFTPYTFTFRGIEFTSMESLLQGLKFEGVETQNSVFQRVGVKAKLRGKKRKWYLNQTLYWQGIPMKRDSEEYKNIVREAFYALAENIDFQQTLLATGNKRLYHTMGKSDPTLTILTEDEFCEILTNLRKNLQIDSK